MESPESAYWLKNCKFCNIFTEFCNNPTCGLVHLCCVKIHLTINAMGNLLYIIAVILIIGWAVGFLGFHAGGLIHVLLIIAIVAVLLRVISGNRAA